MRSHPSEWVIWRKKTQSVTVMWMFWHFCHPSFRQTRQWTNTSWQQVSFTEMCFDMWQRLDPQRNIWKLLWGTQRHRQFTGWGTTSLIDLQNYTADTLQSSQGVARWKPTTLFVIKESPVCETTSWKWMIEGGRSVRAMIVSGQTPPASGIS